VRPVRNDVVVVGQLARDLVLVVDKMPEPGESGTVQVRREMLGGRGVNQAVALAQLGMRPNLVAVVGDDRTATDMLDQAHQDGIGMSGVVRRRGSRTGLIMYVVDSTGQWRYLDDLPPSVLLTETDVTAAASVFAAAAWVSVQLQQPLEAALAAARLARQAGARLVLDGAPLDDGRAELLRAADVVRAGPREVSLLAGAVVESTDDARRAAAQLLRQGPSLVALGVGSAGNYFAWREGELMLPLTKTPVVDTTGAGDAFTAALIAGLDRGDGPERAARLAVAAAGATVGHPGGRPELTEAALDHQLALLG
jgi:ribokinase